MIYPNPLHLDKVKVELYEAKNEVGEEFDSHQADTYKAVYKVEPVSGNPSYRISRNVTVKEPETEQLTEQNTSENTVGEGNAGETEDSSNAEEDADADGQTEVVTDLTEDGETTTDEESGLTVSEVMDQAAENGIDLYSMDEGEVVTFMATDVSTQTTKKVTVTRGTCYQYSDYGYGSYLTYKYTVQFGKCEENDKDALRWCIEKPDKRKSRKMSNKLFSAMMYDMMGWDMDCRYKILGYKITHEDETMYIFDLTETEIFMDTKRKKKVKAEAAEKNEAVAATTNQTSEQKAEEVTAKVARKLNRIPFYPKDWQNSFGLPVAEHKKALETNLADGYIEFSSTR